MLNEKIIFKEAIFLMFVVMFYFGVSMIAFYHINEKLAIYIGMTLIMGILSVIWYLLLKILRRK